MNTTTSATQTLFNCDNKELNTLLLNSLIVGNYLELDDEIDEIDVCEARNEINLYISNNKDRSKLYRFLDAGVTTQILYINAEGAITLNLNKNKSQNL
jgi:hypothetical protein